MATAAVDGLIGANPCNIRDAGTEQSAERPLISSRDAKDPAGRTAPEFRCVVLLAEFAQLRLGEILGLLVDDVDLAERSVHIRRQALEVRGQGRKVTPPEATAGVRPVLIPNGLVATLADHIDAFCPQGLKKRWLFATETGHRWYRWEWQQAWNEAKALVSAERKAEGVAELPHGLHMHDLRHSGLTLVTHTGVTTKELMRRGGHASPTTALRYQHVAEGRDREIADALGTLFNAPRNTAQRGAKVMPFGTPRDHRAMGIAGSSAGPKD